MNRHEIVHYLINLLQLEKMNDQKKDKFAIHRAAQEGRSMSLKPGIKERAAS